MKLDELAITRILEAAYRLPGTFRALIAALQHDRGERARHELAARVVENTYNAGDLASIDRLIRELPPGPNRSKYGVAEDLAQLGPIHGVAEPIFTDPSNRIRWHWGQIVRRTPELQHLAAA